jgi:hypothetical protein
MTFEQNEAMEEAVKKMIPYGGSPTQYAMMVVLREAIRVFCKELALIENKKQLQEGM